MDPKWNERLRRWCRWGMKRVHRPARNRDQLRDLVERLEDRLAPAFFGGVYVAAGDVTGDGYADIVTGPGAWGGPHVQVFSGATGGAVASWFAYDPAVTSGVSVAVGDVTGDGRADIVTAPGPGVGPHVKVFDGATGAEVRGFFAYDPGFTGGVAVAVGDVDGDGTAEVVTGMRGGGSEVRVFSKASDAAITAFTAYAPGFAGGTWVATTDLDADGKAEVMTGPGRGGESHVRVFDGTSAHERLGFFAYEPGFTGGVTVAGGDVDGDGVGDIVTGAGDGGGPRVRAFSGRDGSELARSARSFFAYAEDFRGGTHVAVADLDADGLADVITGPGAGMAAEVRAFSGVRDTLLLTNFEAYDSAATSTAFAVRQGEADRVFARDSSVQGALTDEQPDTLAVVGFESRLAPGNVIAGTVFLDGNANGIRDGAGVDSVSGIELGPRGPEVLSNTDDGSTGAIPLGFNFDFYGKSFSQVFVNNNGNLTFTGSLSRYSPDGFPQPTPIVAPFWADVDTRGNIGAVHQSVGVSPRGRPYFQTDWVNVGYYNRGADRRNDFSVYIEDDPAGDIVAFFYRGMQWTTGSDSGAQIGFDSGNGANFLSFARPAKTADLSYLNNVQVAFRVNPSGTPEPIQLESGAPGVTVYLDANNNAVRDVVEPTATTEADNPGTPNVNEAGRYRFDGLPAGNYVIRQDLPRGFVGTAPVNGVRVVTFTSDGGVNGGNDFGRVQVASLAGRATNDTNRNAAVDAADPGLPGATVYLDANGNGVRDLGETFVKSGPAGDYSFDRLPAGSYTVRAVAGDGRPAVAPTDGRQVVTVAAGDDRTGLNFGFAVGRPPRVTGITPGPSATVADGAAELTVQFDAVIDPAARWGPLFTLTAAGGDGRFDNGNEQPLPLTVIGWDDSTRAMRLTAHRLLPRDTYRLTVPDLLVDTAGNKLDGEFRGRLPSGDGTAGGAFVTEFVVSNTPPTADPFSGQTLQVDSLQVQLTARDPDGGSAVARVVEQPRHGTLTPAGGPGLFTYTPAAGFVGVDTFRFVASDGMAVGPVADGRVVVAAAPVDFMPLTLTADAPGGLAVGRSATVNWTVRNAGSGTSVASGGSDWTDEIYLSDDDRLDANDSRLGIAPIDSEAIGPGGNYSGTLAVSIPFSERSGGAFILVRSNTDRGQLELNTGDNVLVTPVFLRPTVDLLTPSGSYIGRNRPFDVIWRDADQQGNGTVTIAIDTDVDPTNGVGHIVLASGLPEDPDGSVDGTNVSLPAALPSGNYFLWTQLDGSSGATFSRPVPVRVFAEAYPAEDAGTPAIGGGGYEVFGVDLAREGDTFSYRVRTNYNPLSSGGEVYINVGGSYIGGGGRVTGIAVRDHTTDTGQPLVAGRLYTGASFSSGSILGDRPYTVRSYTSEATSASSATVTSPPDQPWAHEISGTFSSSAVGADADDAVEVGWGMYCGNDFSATDNDKDRLNLLGAGFKIENPSSTTQATRPRRWGDEVKVTFSVVNQGNAEVGATTVKFVASKDSKIEMTDLPLSVASGEVDVPALPVGQSYNGQVTLRLPEDSPSGFEQVGPIYLGMISDAANSVAESDEADNLNFGFGLDKAELRIGRAKYVNVVIHGYDPNPLSYNDMWDTWDGFGKSLVNFAETSGNQELKNNVVYHRTAWRSSEGWHSALIDVLGYAALDIVRGRPVVANNPALNFAAEALQNMFLADADNAMARAERFARQAAASTVADIRTPNSGQAALLGDPSEDQWIHIIGHSRGGAVGAEVVRQLRGLGYQVDRYTALDGYSTDWPPPSDILADIDIADTVGLMGADTQINYRVEQGLAALVSSPAEDFLERQLSRLLGDAIDLQLTEEFVNRFADWRAPDRADFQNPVIGGQGASSNHLTISPLYFNPASPRKQFNPYDALLEAAAGTNAAQGGRSSALLAVDSVQPRILAQAAGVNTFQDGSFDKAAQVQQLLAAARESRVFGDQLADTILRVTSLPGFGIDTSLDVTGDYQLIDDGGNTVLQLGQTNDTRLADLVMLDSTARQLSFRYASTQAGPGDELVVTFAGKPVARYDLMLVAGTGFHTETVDIARYAGQTGEFKFQLTGPASIPSVIRLDDLGVVNLTTINNPPQIADILARTVLATGQTLVIPLGLSDAETAVADLDVQVTWDNKAVVPDGAALITRADGQQFLNITPTTGQIGTVTFSLVVRDADGATATATFILTVSGNNALLVGYPVLAIGGGAGSEGVVAVVRQDGQESLRFTPFPGFTGGVRTAAADFNGDGVTDVVVGTGPGQPARVQVLDGRDAATQLFATDPFESPFTGGVYVAAGDLTGDGWAELVITPGSGGGPRVRVFNGRGFTLIADFFGIEDPDFRGGAHAAVGDIDGEGSADLVVTAGEGGGPRVAVYRGATLGLSGGPKLCGDFFAFDPDLRSGATVAVGDVDGDARSDVIVGSGPGGGPRVSVLAGADLSTDPNPRLADFFVADSSVLSGIRLVTKDLDGDARADVIATVAGHGLVKMYAGSTIMGQPDGPAELRTFDAASISVDDVYVG